MNAIAQRLSKTDVEQFREQLETQRAEDKQSLRRTEEEQKGLAADRPPELGDFCIESADREYLFERVNQQRRLLNRIERSLERIHSGTFGECITCGEEIPRKRLNAMPSTEYCLQCQDERERMTRLPSIAQFSRRQRVA
jgi:RNA polymerase-binding transcription factor